MRISTLALLLTVGAVAGPVASAADTTILNASYDVTREFFKDYNAAFARHWKQKTGDSGRVAVHGADATGTHLRERQVGFVFQHYAFRDLGLATGAIAYLQPTRVRHFADVA